MKKYSKDDLIRFVRIFIDKNKRYPFRKEFCIYNGLVDFDWHYKPILGNNLIEILKNCGYELTDEEIFSLMGDDERIKIMTKEYCTSSIIGLQNRLGRSLKYDDFRNPKYGKIGIKSIKKYWGNLNNMKKELGLEIIQESMSDKHISFDKLKDDVNKICNFVFLNEGRKIILANDFCKNGLFDVSTYRQLFYKNGENLRDYVKLLGFDLQKIGTGYSYIFNDGEKTNSMYEYNFSNLLRGNGFKYNVSYFRNVKYKTFIKTCDNLMDCDYVFPILDNIYLYIELAGMIKDMKKQYFAGEDCGKKIQKKYVEKLREKEKMLKDNKLNYYIYIPYHYKNYDIVELEQIVKNIIYAKDHSEDLINEMFNF